MKKLRIVSISPTKYIVEAIASIIECSKKQYKTEHVGLSCDLWYGLNATDTYVENNLRVVNIPRSSCVRSSWWKTANVIDEFELEKCHIIKLLKKIINDFKPNVLLISDIEGSLEELIMNVFDENGVKIFYVEHGYGFTDYFSFSVRKKIIMRMKKGIASFTHGTNVSLAIRNIRKKIIVCSFGEINYSRLLADGFARDNIVVTGFPYFDKIYFKAKSLAKTPYNDDKKILFVSTGEYMFRDLPCSFYEFINGTFGKRLSEKHDLYLRTKPGENVDYVKNKLANLNCLHIVDNRSAFYENINDFDLVIGESSNALVEAFRMGVPAVLFISQELRSLPRIQTDFLFSNVIGFSTIKSHYPIDKIFHIIESAISKDEFSEQSLAIAKRLIGVYGVFDGKSADRICEILFQCCFGE
ncbi:MAG: hypothetical protein WCV63_00525 [Negativicutes bacterium]|jgi:hypothetical protein